MEEMSADERAAYLKEQAMTGLEETYRHSAPIPNHRPDPLSGFGWPQAARGMYIRLLLFILASIVLIILLSILFHFMGKLYHL